MAGIATADANALASAEVQAVSYTGAATLYLSLHTADPGSTGANEVTGAGYARQAITFGNPVSGVAANTAALSYVNMPAAVITHLGLWDAPTGGNFRQSGAWSSPITEGVGNSFTVAVGAVTYTVSAV